MRDFGSLPLRDLADALAARIEEIYGAKRPMPRAAGQPATIPDQGLGLEVLPELWSQIIEHSTNLASPWMIGHMDTAPHPAAALTDALVAALNNNLLFRETSPFASLVEERLLSDIANLMGLEPAARGLFCSGGSLANLTALFAACGGFADTSGRGDVRLFVSRAAHGSVHKAAAVLGLPEAAVVTLRGDDCGRIAPDELEARLSESDGGRKIVSALLGSTVQGAVDDIPALIPICRSHDAWLHVDAIYGGALAFSARHRSLLSGLAKADSVTMAPQKWMYVPRLCALTYLRHGEDFDRRLARGLSYSQSRQVHRGTWGLQGSRRADALTLWVALQVMGRRQLAETIDGSMALARRFWEMLSAHPKAAPTHRPDLNLQAFRWGPPDRDGARLLAMQAALAAGGRGWLSVAGWDGESLFRSVLLPPSTNERHLACLLDDLEAAEKNSE